MDAALKLFGQGVLGVAVLMVIWTVAANVAFWYQDSFPPLATLVLLCGIPLLVITVIAHRVFRMRGFTYGVVIGTVTIVVLPWLGH